jgi:N utilization substance protein B
MLFQFDVARPGLDELTGMYWRNFGDEMGDVPQEFANNLAVGAISHLDEIDNLIRQRAENWRISRMAVVDRNILRLAVYEFLYEPTPRTVAINEALEIARRFSTYEATQFINGILDAIKRDLDEQQQHHSVVGPEPGRRRVRMQRFRNPDRYPVRQEQAARRESLRGEAGRRREQEHPRSRSQRRRRRVRDAVERCALGRDVDERQRDDAGRRSEPGRWA